MYVIRSREFAINETLANFRVAEKREYVDWVRANIRAGVVLGHRTMARRDSPEISSRPYPRPQLRRPDWQSLDGQWRFLFDPDRLYRAPSEIKEWPRAIEVPFAPESKRSGIGDTGFHRVCWYE